MKTMIVALSLLTFAGTAMAQPATFTDLGNRLTPQTFTQTVNTGGGAGVAWYRIVLPAVSTTDGYVDISNNLAGTANEITDSMFGFYDDTGALIVYNDDGGPGFWSKLSFGQTTPTRPGETVPGQTNDTDFAGQNGPLAGGVYWLGVCHYYATFNAGWAIAPTYTGTQSDTLLRITVQPPGAPIPPTGAGGSTPASALIGDSVLLTVTVTPGANPVSTGIAVRGDTSVLGGSATQQFYDDGTHGDASAGDGIYSFSITVPASASEGAVVVPFTINDAQARTGGGNISVGIDAAGDSIATANIPSGSGELTTISGFFSTNDVDIFKINICDFANFSATTVGGTTADTQLFLFNPDGTGVTSDDDNPAGGTQSIITSQFVTANGDYYLAVTGYNLDPTDSGGNLIWANTPFGVERAPDGPGSAGALGGWTGTSFYDNTIYTITLTGSCYPSNGPICGPADIGSVGGVAGADGHLDNNDFIVYINNFFNADPSADIGTTGGVPGHDGVFDNNDFIVFIDQFFNAPASCR